MPLPSLVRIARELADAGRDMRLAARSLARTPGFSAVAVLSLGLGLALTACTMAVVNAYLLRSMPFPDAERLHHVAYAAPGHSEPRGLSTLDWGALSDVVELADSSAPTRLHVVDGAYPQEFIGLAIAEGSLAALGMGVASGRSLNREDFTRTAERVAVIGQTLWRARFGADSAVIGRTFRARSPNEPGGVELIRVVGVLPAGFRYAREVARGEVEFVTPLRAPMRTYLVRLRGGVAADHARSRIDRAVREVATSLPPGWAGVELESVHARYVAGVRPVLIAVTIAAALVLLIVCANVAVLTVLRSMRRQREVAVRVALGARRRDILRMLFAESGLICGCALALGLFATGIVLRWLAPVAEARLGRGAPGGTAAIAIDSTVLLVVGALGTAAALSLSLLPLLAPWQRRLADALRRGGRASTDGGTARRTRSALVVTQIAASLALLVGAGLMIRSVLHHLRIDLGFETQQVARARIALPAGRYPHDSLTFPFYSQLQERLTQHFDGSFALANVIPFYEPPRHAIDAGAEGASGLAANMAGIGPGYFTTLGIHLMEGRAFESGDRPGAEPVAIVSRSLARRLWPEGSAIGRRLRTGAHLVSGIPPGPWRTVVGVAGDVRQAYTDRDQLDLYVPFLQAPGRYAPLYIRTSLPASHWLELVRTTVAELDPDALVALSPSLEDESRRLLAGPRFLMTVLVAFAAGALLLALLGIYGVTAYAVGQREREVAIRLALGATGREVTTLFVRAGSVMIAAGVGAGLVAAYGMSRALRHQVHGVHPFDMTTLVGASAIIIAACVVATWWPARRAALTSPMGMLGQD